MNVIKSSYKIETALDGAAILERIERAGRTCYKSEDAISRDSATRFAKMILKRGHFSVIEHESASVRFICDRGITHEIVRHRLASYSQESTRYCNYSKEKFGNEITVIDPRPHYREEEFKQWCLAMKDAEHHYFRLIAGETSAQLARDVLPTSLKTEIVMTANLREWRHFFDLRTSPAAHPQLRELTMPLLAEFRERIPVLFDDVGIVSDE